MTNLSNTVVSWWRIRTHGLNILLELFSKIILQSRCPVERLSRPTLGPIVHPVGIVLILIVFLRTGLAANDLESTQELLVEAAFPVAVVVERVGNSPPWPRVLPQEVGSVCTCMFQNEVFVSGLC